MLTFAGTISNWPFKKRKKINGPYKPVGEGISNDEIFVVPEIPKNTENSNLESAVAVEDFDSINQITITDSLLTLYLKLVV